MSTACASVVSFRVVSHILKSGDRIRAFIDGHISLRTKIGRTKHELIACVIEESRRNRRNALDDLAPAADGGAAPAADGGAADGADGNSPDFADFADVSDPCATIVEYCRPRWHRKWSKMAIRQIKRQQKKNVFKQVKTAMKTCWSEALASNWTLSILKQQVMERSDLALTRVLHRAFHKLIPRMMAALKGKRGRPRKCKLKVQLMADGNAWREILAMQKEDGRVGKLLALKII